MNNFNIGILAHVDAGKTTLSESMLYKCGTIRKLGRVDHKDSYLDTNNIEKQRGITVFSKQAQITTNNINITLLDTPGHVDLSPETERVLSVIDYAILVISAQDGVTAHTETLWKLLKTYNIPVFIFVNKMDMPCSEKNIILEDIKSHLSEFCVDFTNTKSDEFMESVALSDEKIFETYSEKNIVFEDDLKNAVAQRKLFPCYFGSALKSYGIEEFIKGLETYLLNKTYPSEFGAIIYKISHDEQGNRLSFLKVTGGNLKVKEEIETSDRKEKINQIRIYSGNTYKLAESVEAGTICAVTGLDLSYAGQGTGFEKNTYKSIIKPVMNYRVILPPDVNIHESAKKIKQLEEEEPSLNVIYNQESGDINIRIMGEVQLEIIKALLLERYDLSVEFGSGNIIYKETVADKSIGVGHYEPLKHYAEVQLLIEPSEHDGIEFESRCSEDILSKNWQRLIKNHVFEKEHKGVLTGSQLTGIKITLLTGKAHIKHTDGGDFRQATYRAIRNGLAKNETVLLEPYYEYRLEVPSESLGRAMTDIQTRFGTFSQPVLSDEMAILSGEVPVSTMQGYMNELNSYTKGKGRLICNISKYKECHNQEEIVDEINYDFDSDIENSADSIFCKQGSAYLVKWYEVEKYKHTVSEFESAFKIPDKDNSYLQNKATEAELEAIFEREFGKRERKVYNTEAKTHGNTKSTLDNYVYKEKEQQKECLLVDGYNIIHAWKELSDIADVDFNAARGRLVDILSNYQAFRKCLLIIVFDAYRVKGGMGSKSKYHNVYVVFTKEAETADMYIEKTTHEISSKYRVRVATSDAMEQIIILGRGATRISAREFENEVNAVAKEIQNTYSQKSTLGKQYLGSQMEDLIK